ncbi:MAG: aminotransferase class I/II-fold pyridoxal phosphate-dependent enzyme [Syntrophomonadaceae bacterium]
MPSATPIYSALLKYAEEKNIRLHMPGHIGRGIPASEFNRIALFDVTEVPGLDDLHLPRQEIEAARQFLARAFGAAESFFLVNGATSGIQALFMGLCSDQEKVLVPRNAHRSFYAGMVLSGAMPVYIPVEAENRLGVAFAVKVADIEQKLATYPGLKVVFITSPSYYGTTCAVSEIASTTKALNKLLVVDEAHGAHFPFHKMYPASALQGGADAAVNGLHKTLPVLNQGACLHIADTLLGNERLRQACSLMTTTSPSYPIMASIDLARCFMEERGQELLGQAREYAMVFREKVNKIKGFWCPGNELRTISGVQDFDPLKVLIFVQGTGLSGQTIADILRQKYHIQVELAENNIILAMFSMFHKRDDWQRFYNALKDIARFYSAAGKAQVPVAMPPEPQVILSPRQAFLAGKKRVLLKESLNRVAGEMIAPYPPGIPCVLPGELITPQVWEYLNYLGQIKVNLHGPEDPTLKYITVLEES